MVPGARVAPLVVFAVLVAAAGAAADKGHELPFRSLLRRSVRDAEGELHWDRTARLPERRFVDAPDLAAASLVVSPSVLQASGDKAVVSWAGVAAPKSNDWMGLYLSEGDTNQQYVDFLYVSESPTWASGNGSLAFSMINLRRTVHFRYFQYKGNDAYQLVARSNALAFANVNEPLQGHLALTDNIDEMRVMFTTNSFSTPIVQYGTAPGQYTDERTGTSGTYTADMMCGEPASIVGPNNFIDPGVLHDVLLTGLRPATRYYYRFGTREHGFSSERSFRSAPVVGTPGTRFIAYGDMGEETPAGPSVAKRVQAEAADMDFILHFGDVSYALGRGWLWETWATLLDPIATLTPYQISIGNHEMCYISPDTGKDPSGEPSWHPVWGNYGVDSGNECGVPMFHRYHVGGGGGNALFWYSFNFANVHILQMSTEHDFTPGSPQYAWMEADLQRVNRSVTPFLVVTGHRPMYNSEKYASDYRVCEGMQAAFEDLLVKYDVDLFLGGHYHSMEVTCFVYRNRCVENNGVNKGAYHVTVGSAGAWVDTAGYYDVVWRQYAEQTYGYERITTNAQEMVLEFVRSSDNVVSHTLRIPRRYV
eukprot:Unigene5513_Nuclearia_a/m.16872 Unigene5513_Nuclearia_a/g.16872  ORF Unigene5513_Nuclearia_a/g.16872 Unigene5513_Nuclearia_a/m.16872 type:complete len:592 (-) Unigene5513_Nuclearia_a:51-1826(-)